MYVSSLNYTKKIKRTIEACAHVYCILNLDYGKRFAARCCNLIGAAHVPSANIFIVELSKTTYKAGPTRIRLCIVCVYDVERGN